jgi:hypothetical protein
MTPVTIRAVYPTQRSGPIIEAAAERPSLAKTTYQEVALDMGNPVDLFHMYLGCRSCLVRQFPSCKGSHEMHRT